MKVHPWCIPHVAVFSGPRHGKRFKKSDWQPQIKSHATADRITWHPYPQTSTDYRVPKDSVAADILCRWSASDSTSMKSLSGFAEPFRTATDCEWGTTYVAVRYQHAKTSANRISSRFSWSFPFLPARSKASLARLTESARMCRSSSRSACEKRKTN